MTISALQCSPSRRTRDSRPWRLWRLCGAWSGRWLTTALAWLALMPLLMSVPLPARSDTIELPNFEVVYSDEGVTVAFAAQFELSRAVQDALLKGVPLHFVAEAEVFRERWYWRDQRVAAAKRNWRLSYQPLTRKYRVTFSGLNQSYDELSDALNAVRSVSGWKIADAGQLDEGARHYLEFSFRLDTTQLPRPMQIGIGGLADWSMSVERVRRLARQD